MPAIRSRTDCRLGRTPLKAPLCRPVQRRHMVRRQERQVQDVVSCRCRLDTQAGQTDILHRLCRIRRQHQLGKAAARSGKGHMPGRHRKSRCRNRINLTAMKKDPNKRYKMFNVERRPTDRRWQFILKYSPDGIHWSKGVAQSGDLYDRSSVFYNPFRGVWCLSMRYSTAVSSRSAATWRRKDHETAVSMAPPRTQKAFRIKMLCSGLHPTIKSHAIELPRSRTRHL